MLLVKTEILYKSQSAPENETPRERISRHRRCILDDERKAEIVHSIEGMNRGTEGRFRYYLSRYSDGKITGVAVLHSPKDMADAERRFSDLFDVEKTEIRTEEILFREMRRELNGAYHEDFIADDDDVIRDEGLGVYDANHVCSDWGENLADEVPDLAAALEQARNTLYVNTLSTELRRIFKKPAPGVFYGHPVHYMFLTESRDARKDAYRLLLGALFSCRRFQNKRYVFVDYDPTDSFSFHWLEDLFKSGEGGVVVLRYQNTTDDGEESEANVNREGIEAIASIMKRYANRVLTVLCLPRDAIKIREIFYENLGTLNMVEVVEERVGGEKAREYLRTLCKTQNYKPDKNLYLPLKPGSTFNMKELQDIFDKWVSEKLVSAVYPQYRSLEKSAVVAAKEAPKCSAYEELMGMVGLAEAKKTINDAINFFKAQKLFRESGVVCAERPSMHMVFSGAPGTAKTSVARLMAEIFREEGILPTGRFCEVSRADLCEKYVGWTAKKVKKIFQDTKGGLIFVDEAYSLCDDHNGGYGKEAIDTLVAEMENNRDDTMVVFAGYADPMDTFLEQNPGLRSRISFHVHFSDYVPEDLCRIAEGMAAKKGLLCGPGVREKMQTVFAGLCLTAEFGNGRAARNVIEQAQMRLATRIMQTEDLGKVTKEEMTTLLPEDVESPVLTASVPAPAKKIGFVA